jgi:hypothetical protein
MPRRSFDIVFGMECSNYSTLPRAKVNWGKSATIWANKKQKEWEWGQEVEQRCILEGQGVRYVGIQIGFRLPTKAHARPKKEDDRTGQV